MSSTPPTQTCAPTAGHFQSPLENTCPARPAACPLDPPFTALGGLTEALVPLLPQHHITVPSPRCLATGQGPLCSHSCLKAPQGPVVAGRAPRVMSAGRCPRGLLGLPRGLLELPGHSRNCGTHSTLLMGSRQEPRDLGPLLSWPDFSNSRCGGDTRVNIQCVTQAEAKTFS